MYIGFNGFALAYTASVAGILAASFFQTGDSAYRVFANTPQIPGPFMILFVCILMCLVGVLFMILLQKFSFSPQMANVGIIALLYGVSHVYLHNSEVGQIYLDGFSSFFRNISAFSIGNDPIYSIPFSVILSILICIGIWIAFRKMAVFKKIIHKSKLAHYNAQKSGFTWIELLIIFCSSAFVASFGGIMRVAYAGSVNADFGLNFLFDILVISLISGFSVFGGKGKFPMLIIGTFMYTASCYAVDFVGLGRFTSYLIRAVIIMVSIGVDIYLRQKRSKEKATLNTKASETKELVK